MIQLMYRIDALVLAVGVQLPQEPHARGSFSQVLLGYKHGMGNAANVRRFTAINPVALSHLHRTASISLTMVH
jgi:hypothetical protein